MFLLGAKPSIAHGDSLTSLSQVLSMGSTRDVSSGFPMLTSQLGLLPQGNMVPQGLGEHSKVK